MPQTGIPAESIRKKLDKILSSGLFCHAERPRRFLRFIVEETFKDDATSLKEYSIGTAVLERPPSFDPRVDSIVRVEAGRLRSRLTEYYKTEGSDDPVVITLPKGQYVPVFCENRDIAETQDEESSTEEAQAVHLAQVDESAGHGLVGRRIALIMAAIVIAVGVLAIRATVSRWFPAASERAASEPVRSLAILPLANLSGDPSQEYFADGMTEVLITELGAISTVRVISRTSVMQYKHSQTPLPEIHGN